MSNTANLILPLLEAAQAQKHVTMNQALLGLDAIVQLSVLDRDLATPPGSPADGDRYLVATGATGAWVGKDDHVAAWQDGAWVFYPPRTGWRCWIGDEAALVVFDGSLWNPLGSGGGGSGEANTASNVGTGADIFKQKNGANLEFRGLEALGPLSAVVNLDNIDLSIAAATTSAAGSMSGADKAKLDGIEAGADVTDAANVAAAGALLDSDFAASQGYLRKTGGGTYEAVKSNLSATTDPGAADDSAAGYAVGSRWINLTADTVHECVDATAGAAVWKDLSAGAGGGEVNQNAFSTIAVAGQSAVVADQKTDTLTLVGGANVTLTTNAATDEITIAASGGGGNLDYGLVTGSVTGTDDYGSIV